VDMELVLEEPVKSHKVADRWLLLAGTSIRKIPLLVHRKSWDMGRRKRKRRENRSIRHLVVAWKME
jgi:hypothetical protein